MRSDLLPRVLGDSRKCSGSIAMNFRDVNPVYNPLLYFIGKNLQALAFRIIWRRKVRGLENVPPFGTPVIFAANHRSLTDPSHVGSSLPYPIFYFVKEELFH